MKQLILLIWTFVLIATSCQNEKQISSISILEIYADSLFQASIDSAEIAGAAILVYQNGDTLLKKSYGYASLELSTPMPSDGIFDIGSVTKQFTAAAILKLAEDGKLSLDDDFTKYLDFDTKGRKITIAQLLDHTSGLPNVPDGTDEFTQMSFDEFPHKLTVTLVQPKEFLHEPGEVLIYNNVAFVFAGLIIENVTGQSYEDYLKETFFDPLGMKSTSFGSNSKVLKNKVNGYNYKPDGLQKMDFLNYYIPYSAGSLISSTDDLLTWTRALHSGEVFSEAMYQYMISPSKLNDGSATLYAKGLTNFSNYGHQEISHGGAIAGFSSYLQYLPEEDLYIICLINTIGQKNTGQFFANEITWELLGKMMPIKEDLDLDIQLLEATYIGPTRGNKSDTVKVSAIKEGILIHQSSKADKVDTLSTYIGNNTWAVGNNRVVIKNNEYREIQPYNYYILKEEE